MTSIRKIYETKSNNKTRSKMIKDRMLDVLFAKLSESSLRDNVVLQGGYTLHKVYSSARYTDDIDFVWANKVDPKKFQFEFENLLTEIEDYEVSSSIKFKDNSFVRTKYSINLDAKTRFVIRLEGCNALPMMETEKIETEMGYLYVESVKEIALDKIIATFSRFKDRGSLKPSDIYDLHIINQQFDMAFSPEEIIKKLDTYGLDHSILGSINDICSYILDKKEDIITEISSQLVDVQKKNIDFNKIIGGVCKYFLLDINNLNDKINSIF